MNTPCPRRVEIVDLLTSPEGASPEQLAHIDRCVNCSREWAELAPLPDLVARSGWLDATPDTDADERERDLGAILGRVRRRRRHRLVGLAGALAAAGIAGGVTAVATAGGGQQPAKRVASGPGPVRLSARLDARAWGTEVTVAADGLPARALCELVVRSDAGEMQVAGWWWSGRGRVGSVPVATSIAEHDIAAVQLLVAGRPVATAKTPTHN